MQAGDASATSRALSVLDARLDPASPAPLALGLSGGGDSLALLTLVLAWAQPRGRRVLALTVDHGLQARSADWTAAAGAQARRLGADWRGLAWTGPKPTTGLAAAARRARHALLAEAARQAGASILLLGHTADDVLEGERMRAGGTPLGRLRDWAPSPVWPEGRDVFLLRPLLAVSRAELREHLSRLGLEWIEDPANADPRSARARARAELAHESSISPLWGERPAEPAVGGYTPDGSARAPLGGRSLSSGRPMAGPGGPPLPPEGGDLELGLGVLTLPRAAFRTASEPDARAALAVALVCAAGQERPPRGPALDRLLQRLRTGEAFTATLAGARLEAGGEIVHIFREAGEAARGGLAPLRLEAGQSAVWDGRFEITAAEPGEVRAARGLAGRLDETDRLALKPLPAAARAAAPVLIRDADPRPVLAGRVAEVRSLVERRRTASCGLIAHEREIAGRTRGANGGTSLC